MEDWIDTLAGHSLECPLPTLKLILGTGEELKGSGHVRWSAERGIVLTAITDGAADLSNVWGDCLLSAVNDVGQVNRSDQRLRLQGSSHDEWEVESTRPLVDGFSVRTESEHVVWEVSFPHLKFIRNDSRAEQNTIRALIQPAFDDWPRATLTTVENPVFGHTSRKRDWLQTTSEEVSVSVRRHSVPFAELQMNWSGDQSEDAALAGLTAAIRAFSFAIGKQARLIGHEFVSGSQHVRLVRPYKKSPARNSLCPPLGDGIAFLHGIEHLIDRVTRLFETDVGKAIARHLEVCWDTVDNDIGTRLTTIGVCLEGLVRLVDRGQSAKGKYESDRTRLIEWLTNDSNLDVVFVNRIKGFVNCLDERRPADILHEWREQGILGITEAEVIAFKSIRNAGAHAGFLKQFADRDDLQEKLNHYHRIVNLINRIVLDAAGFQGKVVNYSAPCWPEHEFSARPD